MYLDSNDLGAMKLEYIADEAVFLAPKVYAFNIINKDILSGLYIMRSFSHVPYLIRDS